MTAAMKNGTYLPKIKSHLSEVFILIIFGIVNLIPIFWGVITSLKTQSDITAYPPKIWNFELYFGHYKRVISSGFFQCVLNSAFYSVAAIFLGVITGYLAAYGFSRRNFPFKKLCFYFIVVGIPLSSGSSVLLIPNYLHMMKMGLHNHWYTLILLYTTYNLPMTIWLLIAGIRAVPQELEEAAIMDGCSQFYIVTRLIPPLIKPSIAAASLFVFIGSWNEYITSSVMINDTSLKNIQMAIYDYLGFFGQEWGPLTAAATLAIIPIVFVFTFLGKQLVSGLTAGAVKG